MIVLITQSIYGAAVDNAAKEVKKTSQSIEKSYSKEEAKEADTTDSDKRGENRQIRRNGGLNDIIRILILRELLGRPRMLWTKLQTWYGSKASYATKTTFS